MVSHHRLRYCASCLSGKNRLRSKFLLQDTSDQRAALTSCYNNKYKQHKNINRLEVFTPTGTPAESIWAINWTGPVFNFPCGRAEHTQSNTVILMTSYILFIGEKLECLFFLARSSVPVTLMSNKGFNFIDVFAAAGKLFYLHEASLS